jgi:hypothetical protein
VEERRKAGLAFIPRAILDMDGERSRDRDRADVGLVESRRVELGIARAHPQGDLAVTERVRGEESRDGLGPIDDPPEQWLRGLDATRAHSDLSGNGYAIDVTRDLRHPGIERGAARTHRERHVGLAARGVDPRAETIQDLSTLAISERVVRRLLEIGSDTELPVARAPRARAVREDHARIRPRLRKLPCQPFVDRVAIERAHRDARNHHSGEGAAREHLLRGRAPSEGDRDEHERRQDELERKAPRGAKLALFASRDDRHLVDASPSDASLTHTLEQGACRIGLARSLGMTLSTSLDAASVSVVPTRRD